MIKRERGSFMIELAILLPILLIMVLIIFDVRFYLSRESEVQYLLREVAVAAYHDCYGLYRSPPAALQACLETTMYEQLALARESEKDVKLILSGYGQDGEGGVRRLALSEAGTAAEDLKDEHTRLGTESVSGRYGKLIEDVDTLLIVEVIVPFRPLLGYLSFFRSDTQYAVAGV